MTRDSRYDIFFEPVKIGPVMAKNRFYQVPHCGGMGFNWPQSDTKVREMKAQGGWAVVCTEDCSIHPSANYSPSPQARLWDGYDIKCLALMIDAVHRRSIPAEGDGGRARRGNPRMYRLQHLCLRPENVHANALHPKPGRGEEWQRGWHPEKIARKGSDDSVRAIGAGPAGLEAACWRATRRLSNVRHCGGFSVQSRQ
jgi:hypothetical protein